MTRRDRFRFFFDHAGYCTPPGRAACALQLARAEELLETACDLAAAYVRWEDDPEPYDPGDADTPEEAARYFADNTWSGPYGCVVGVYSPGDTEPSEGTSLWGIVLDSRDLADPYARVIAAELASELEDELRQAIGDARDALDPNEEDSSITRRQLHARGVI